MMPTTGYLYEHFIIQILCPDIQIFVLISSCVVVGIIYLCMQKKQPHVDSAASKSEPNVVKSLSSQKPEKKMKMVYIVELVYS